MHGFSVYLSHPIDKSYIDNMIDLGYTTIFTSVQIPEEDDDKKYRYLIELLDYLSTKQVTYMIDINPSLLNHSFYQFLQQYEQAHFIIRIDHSTSIDIVTEIINHGFHCCLNASIISELLLQQLSYQLEDFSHLCYCHNYYPRPDTGLESQFVKAQNEMILKYNAHANIYGFIAGSTLRGPIYKGLPTIEDTRYKHPIESAQILRDHLVAHIMIGDTQLHLEYAKRLMNFLRHRHFTLTIEVLDQQAQYILEKSHTVRPDNPGKVIRSQEARHYCTTEIQPFLTNERYYGAITIDNIRNGRYQGELQLIKQHLPSHEHINIVGKVLAEDQSLLHCMRPNDKFNFINQSTELR